MAVVIVISKARSGHSSEQNGGSKIPNDVLILI